LSTLTQLISDTPGASRATWVSVRGSVVPLAEKEAIERFSVKPALEIAQEAPQAKLSTFSQVIADTPGASRTTVITVRGTVVPEAEASRVSTYSQVIADTPGAARWVTVRATVTAEEAARLSTLSQMIGDTPGAARATEISRASAVVLRGTVVKDDGLPAVYGAPPPDEAVTVLGNIVPEAQATVEQNRLSTLTQLINTTPGAARGTLITMRGTVKSRPGSTVTAQVVIPTAEAKKLSTLSQVITDTPGGTRATMVTVRGTVVSQDETRSLSTMSGLVADTPGAARATLASVLGGSFAKAS
jgi:hypothetical protein